jgi:hypothetical protein
MLPPLHHLRENRDIDCFDLLPQCSERSSPGDFGNALRAPLDSRDLAPEFSRNELSSSLPLSESRLDPSRLPTVPRHDFIDRDGPR